MKALLDTCVIMDHLQKREPFHAAAKEILTMAATEQVQAYTTAKAVTDMYYILHRATHDDTQTRSILAQLLKIIGILDTQGMDCKAALLSPIGDYEDAVMIETAVRSGMDCIVTRNERDYNKAPIPVYTPEKFVLFLKSD